MGWRGTAVLGVLVLAVGTYVWLDRSAQPDPRAIEFARPRAPTVKVQHLLEFKPDQVITVRLEHEGKILRAMRDGDRWADTQIESDLEDFLQTLSGLGVLAEIPAPADLKDFGLEPAERVLTLGLRAGGAPLVLEIGDPNPSTTGVYIRTGENGPVILAGALTAWEFDKIFRALATAGGDAPMAH